MICSICETEIKEGESFYETYESENQLQPETIAHSDCLIRQLEFNKRYKEAKEIQEADLTETLNRGR